MIAQRLKQLRLAQGLSMDGLVEKIDRAVTKQAISKYEQGKAQPTPKVLRVLADAFGVDMDDLLRQPEFTIDFNVIKEGSTLGKKEQLYIENYVREVLEERIRLQEITGELTAFALPIRKYRVEKIEDAENVAMNLREQWKLGHAPIADVMGMVEDRLIHVLEIEAQEKFSGMSAIMFDQASKPRGASVIIRKGLSGEQQRVSLVRQLGRLVMKVVEKLDHEDVLARFGGAFLAPAEILFREVGRKRGLIQGEELVMLKLRFGMSVQELLDRLLVLNIITTTHHREWGSAINRKEHRENEPYTLKPEEPRWLRRTVLRALSEGLMSHADAKRLLNEDVEEESSPSISLIERQALLALSLTERRRVMVEQIEVGERGGLSIANKGRKRSGE